jgi:hypothetical protein
VKILKIIKYQLKIKLKDARPDVGYQVGVTPEFTEEPKCHKDINCQKLISQVLNLIICDWKKCNLCI